MLRSGLTSSASRVRAAQQAAGHVRRALATVAVGSSHLLRRVPASVQQQAVAFPAQTLLRRLYSTELPPHRVLTFPKLSPTMETGNLHSWGVKEGAKVSDGDTLCEIETDKATMVFESPETGYVAKLLVPEGANNIPIGKPIIVICEEKEDLAKFANFKAEGGDAAAAPAAAPAKAAAPAAAAPAAAAPAAAAPAAAKDSGDSRVKASPLAKRLAQEANIALSKLTGTGQGGRITVADVEAAKSSPAAAAPAAAAAAPKAAAPAAAAAQSEGSYVDVPLTNMRKVIAQRLMESKQKIPHYYLSIDVNVDKALTLRQELNALGKGDFKISMNDFVIKASALALKKVPEVNSSWMDTFIRQHRNVDISVAVATDAGLITPIVSSTDRRGLAEISQKVKELADKAKSNKLAPHEFQGGTFTISNLGMFGVKSFSAIINPPQACILAVGKTDKQVVLDSNAPNGVAEINVMNVTLSCDHRVVDGAVGAKWLAAFKGYLENPVTMML